MLPQDRLDQIAARFEFLEAQLNAGPAADQIARISREYAELKPVVAQIDRWRAAQDGLVEARALLADLGLAGLETRRPAQLSGGEQQRVAFCRALANQPALLLADEPTGNLDPETSDRVFDVLMGLVRDTGLSALIATHNHALAARMDRVVRLTAA